MFKSLRIRGLRGFADEQTLELAVPTGAPGSGLTVLVGSNNAGKSTAIEALRALGQHQSPSFTQGRRNLAAGDYVDLRLCTIDNQTAHLHSTRGGSSETIIECPSEIGELKKRLLVLPSRRAFNPYFGKLETTRDDYMQHIGFPIARSSALDQFTYRLFAIEKNRTEFDRVLSRLLDPVPDWSIDQIDSGQHFLKISANGTTHSSEGMGEGLVSLLYIVDALYDSNESHLIAIDEPELSLHPALQRKLSALLLEYASTRQIVIATHSPYMVSIEALVQGSTLARAHVTDSKTVISQLSHATSKLLHGLMRNQNNPHILGVNAQEIFFCADQVVLMEGQEDIVFLERVQESIGVRLKGNLLGWGVGGAENMRVFARLLRELGFLKLVGILDGNRSSLASELAKEFPGFHFFAIQANDIRTKKARPAVSGVEGLLDEVNMAVRPEFVDDTRIKFEEANDYLSV
jgi:predicted ATP-dependent endonuclease of OLD family